MSKIIKRTRTWTTKSGKKKSKTYYYEKTTKGTTRITKKGKQTKQTFKSITKQRRANINTIDKAKEYFKEKSISLGSDEAQGILNAIRSGRTFTEAQVDERLKRQPGDKGGRDINNLLRALGYSKQEFIEAVGISESEFNLGTFKKVGNDIEFKTQEGATMYFQWDYDAGFIL
jgi:hypothetical protein